MCEHLLTGVRDDPTFEEHSHDALSGGVGIRHQCVGLGARYERAVQRVVAIGEEFGDEPNAVVTGNRFGTGSRKPEERHRPFARKLDDAARMILVRHDRVVQRPVRLDVRDTRAGS